MTEYFPESTYSVDSTLTRANLKKGDIVTGKVVEIKKAQKYLIVDLGSLKAKMSFEHCSIYKIQTHSGMIDPNIYLLYGKIIRAKVVEVGETIILSRNELMEEALDYFKTTNPSKFEVSIIGFTKLSAIVDVGAGIHGRIVPSEFAKTHFNDIQDIGLPIGYQFTARNLSYTDSIKTFELSRVAILSSEPNHLNIDDIVTFKAFKNLDGDKCYLGLIDKKYPALLNSKVKLSYGKEVQTIIKKITAKGFILKSL